MTTDERLNQLANDPMMCNITPEVQECLRELIKARATIKAMHRQANEDAREAARDARDAAAEAYWQGRQGEEHGTW